MSDIDHILDFWLGPRDAAPAAFREFEQRWYVYDAELDQDISTKFLGLLNRAETGELDDWTSSSEGTLALIVLLDQFSRNLYRGSPKAFSNDSRALALALDLIHSKHYNQLTIPEKLLLYHPLQHSEREDIQQQSTDLISDLLASAPEEWRASLTSKLDWAKNHAGIIAKFGRFPHRNQILGRESTDAELTYLSEDERNYGQSS